MVKRPTSLPSLECKKPLDEVGRETCGNYVGGLEVVTCSGRANSARNGKRSTPAS